VTARRPRRILVSAFGSAGDLFPLVPVIDALRDRGHDVRCALPRSLGLVVRQHARLPVYGIGSGTEVRAVDDRRLVTNRFDGWASWRHTLTDYVAPALARDVEAFRKVFASWLPDIVVTSSFAVAARLAAEQSGVPRLDVTIYPQHLRRFSPGSRFARWCRTAIAELDDAGGQDDPDAEARMSRVLWGASDTLLLHDPALLGDEGPGPATVMGFPYWDGDDSWATEVAELEHWADRHEKVVVVTLGSFLGVERRRFWMAAAEASARLDVPMVFMGPQRDLDDPGLDGRGNVLRLGYVPLSRIAARIDLLVHHGGIGTTFGALRAGCPTLVVPQAFDQCFNARMVDQAGVGLDGNDLPIAEGIAAALNSPQLAPAARSMATRLVPSSVAVDRVVDRALERAAG
jgi:UDP:flavonoid glycosyltransferase YjiC (YdhE family)